MVDAWRRHSPPFAACGIKIDDELMIVASSELFQIPSRHLPAGDHEWIERKLTSFRHRHVNCGMENGIHEG